MASLKWSHKAKEDIKDIFFFISKDSKFYADNFIIKIRTEVKRLKEFPKLGRVVPEFGDQSLREIIFQNYRIVYKIVGDEIIIVSIFHSARSIDNF